MSITPKQARELAELRKLAQRMLDLASRLEADLVDKETKKRIMASAVPTPEAVARMAKLMREKGPT